jgi:hypothetical protein
MSPINGRKIFRVVRVKTPQLKRLKMGARGWVMTGANETTPDRLLARVGLFGWYELIQEAGVTMT